MVVCSICKDGTEKGSLIFTCIKCNVKVHQVCYGSRGDAKEWKCSPCMVTNSKFISCLLCHQKHGAFKYTTCKKWIHVVCAIFTDNINIIDENTIDTSKITETKLRKICVFCYNTKGTSTKCAHEKCKNHLHITCGQANRSLNVINDQSKISFNAYCKDHKPINASSGLLLSKYMETVYRKIEESYTGEPIGSTMGIRICIRNHRFII